jgi:hypothetical protein
MRVFCLVALLIGVAAAAVVPHKSMCAFLDATRSLAWEQNMTVSPKALFASCIEAGRSASQCQTS